MINKDVVAPGRMRRRIENPRILLLDCPLEYKKGESQTNVELMKESDWCVVVVFQYAYHRHTTLIDTTLTCCTSSLSLSVACACIHSTNPSMSHHIHLDPNPTPHPRATLLRIEEEWIQQACSTIAEFKPDLVITEKGLSDLATHYLTKAGISAIRRLRKTDNNRIARACGATIVNRVDEVGCGGGWGVLVLLVVAVVNIACVRVLCMLQE